MRKEDLAVTTNMIVEGAISAIRRGYEKKGNEKSLSAEYALGYMSSLLTGMIDEVPEAYRQKMTDRLLRIALTQNL